MTRAGGKSELERARAAWQHRGQRRPSWAVTPRPGQESVWDYPRPPALVSDTRTIRVMHGDTIVARTRDAVRVLETASPPTFYLPPTDVRTDLLAPGRGSSHCEWKGRATYWSLRYGSVHIENVAWSYEDPYPEFSALAGHFSFYPNKLACYVDEERARPQPGAFYGGWITSEIVGPFKGERGTGAW